MALKGQKFKSYSNELRQEIVKKYFNNISTVRLLSKEYQISEKTIWNWITKVRNQNYNLIDQRPILSGNHKEENINYKEKYEILKKYQTFLKAQRERK